MKRGQLSILLILAVLVMILIGFTIYLGQKLAPSAKNIEVKPSVTNARLCLEDATKSAVLGAMKRGGVNEEYWTEHVQQLDLGAISRSTYDLPTSVDPLAGWPPRGEMNEFGHGTISNLSDAPAPPSYRGIEPEDKLSALNHGPGPVRVWIERGPDYLEDVDSTIIALGTNLELLGRPTDAGYGNLSVEPLCAFNGSNRPNAGNDGTSSCLQGTYRVLLNPPILSFQEALEKEISTTIQNHSDICRDIGPVFITLGDNDVTAIAGNISVTIPVKLKRMYNLAYVLAKNNIKDPFMNPLQPSTPSVKGCQDPVYGEECLTPGLKITVNTYEDTFENLTDESMDTLWPWMNHPVKPFAREANPDYWIQGMKVVTITDTQVTVDGEHPVFRFAVKNRYPIAHGAGGIAEYTDPLSDPPINDPMMTMAPYDPDGDPMIVSCESPLRGPAPGTPILPYCNPSMGNLSNAQYRIEPFCDKVPTPVCDVPSTCTATDSEQFTYLFCTIPDKGFDDSVRPVTTYGYPVPTWTTDPLSPTKMRQDELPRNCRLARGSVSTIKCPLPPGSSGHAFGDKWSTGCIGYTGKKQYYECKRTDPCSPFIEPTEVTDITCPTAPPPCAGEGIVPNTGGYGVCCTSLNSCGGGACQTADCP